MLWAMLRKPLSGQGFRTFLIAILFCCPTTMYGQTNPSNANDPKSSGQSAADLRFQVVWNSRNGSFTYIPEKWGELRLSIENQKNEPRDLLCTTYFGEERNLQFGRRVWVPPHSRLRINHPVLIPKHEDSKGDTINMHSLVVEGNGADEVLVRNETGQFLHDGSMLVSRTARNTGLIVGPNSKDDPSTEVQDLVSACRVSVRLSNKLVILDEPFLSTDEYELNYLDHLVIAENRLLDDFAALAAVRRWMYSGGSLWVMLDRVDPVLLERLLGDEYSGHVIDQVGLTNVRIDRSPTLMDPVGIRGDEVEFEKPVSMTRMAVSDMDVLYTVNNWPAAFTRKYGTGRLLVTTVGPRAWMMLREAYRKRGDNSPPTFELVPVKSMKSLVDDAFNVRLPELLPQTLIEPLAREYIGYTIPSWSLVVGTLFGFLLALTVTGFVLLRLQRIEYLGLVGSLLAIVTSTVPI